MAHEDSFLTRCGPTNRWTGAPGSDFRIIRHPAKLLGSAVARSTQPFDASFAPMVCPACNHQIRPWQVWKVSRWSYILCPVCSIRLTRKLDLQLFLIIGLMFGPLLLANRFSWYWPLVAIVISWPIAYLVDVYTVRLYAVGRWRGWLLGYGILR